MPTYRIRSGALDRRITTPYEADGLALAILAVAAHGDAGALADLIEVSGGQYRGECATYTLAAEVLRRIGAAPGNARPN